MKYAASAILLAFSCLAAPAYAIDFWNSSTVYANQGQCSAQFSFDSAMDEIKKLSVAVSAIDKSGKKVTSGVLEVEQFGESNANRYAYAFLEGEEICNDDLTILVTKATAMVNGKRTDLLKSKWLSARDFKPFKIRVGK